MPKWMSYHYIKNLLKLAERGCKPSPCKTRNKIEKRNESKNICLYISTNSGNQLQSSGASVTGIHQEYWLGLLFLTPFHSVKPWMNNNLWMKRAELLFICLSSIYRFSVMEAVAQLLWMERVGAKKAGIGRLLMSACHRFSSGIDTHSTKRLWCYDYD